IALFRCWLRSCCEVTTTPEGKCVMRTALSVLLTCWPPGPLARKVSTSHSRSKSSSESGKRIMFGLWVGQQNRSVQLDRRELMPRFGFVFSAPAVTFHEITPGRHKQPCSRGSSYLRKSNSEKTSAE